MAVRRQTLNRKPVESPAAPCAGGAFCVSAWPRLTVVAGARSRVPVDLCARPSKNGHDFRGYALRTVRCRRMDEHG